MTKKKTQAKENNIFKTIINSGTIVSIIYLIFQIKNMSLFDPMVISIFYGTVFFCSFNNRVDEI